MIQLKIIVWKIMFSLSMIIFLEQDNLHLTDRMIVFFVLIFTKKMYLFLYIIQSTSYLWIYLDWFVSLSKEKEKHHFGTENHQFPKKKIAKSVKFAERVPSLKKLSPFPLICFYFTIQVMVKYCNLI